MKFDIDIAIVFGFLFINLIIGLFYGRGVKNIKDYALGGIAVEYKGATTPPPNERRNYK